MARKIIFTIVIAIAFLSGYLFNIWVNYAEKTNSTPFKQNVVNSKPMSEKSVLQENKFSEEDIKTFELIKGFYKDFEYSDKYTVTSKDEMKIIFNKENILYFDTYISYDVTYDGIDIVNYWFDAGTAYRGHGSYYVIDDDTVIKIEKVIGTSAYSYEISKNGVTIDSETKKVHLN